MRSAQAERAGPLCAVSVGRGLHGKYGRAESRLAIAGGRPRALAWGCITLCPDLRCCQTQLSSSTLRGCVVEEVIRSVHACASVFPGTAITTYPHHLVHVLSKHGSIQIQQAPGCMKLFIESILLCQVASLHLASNIAQHVHSCVVHLHS